MNDYEQNEFIDGEGRLIDEKEHKDYKKPQGPMRVDPSSPKAAFVFVGLNVLMYVIMTLYGLATSTDLSGQLYIFGAKHNASIDQGHYWRLFMAMFLHVGFFHLLLNGYVLYIYGPFVEKLFGKWRFSVIYILAGLSSSMFSYVLTQNPSAGASGAIFGLFGALLFFRERQKDVFNSIFGNGIMMFLGINLFLGFIIPQIDNWGHIGGLIGGYLIARALNLFNDKNYTISNLWPMLVYALIMCAGLIIGGR